MQKLKGDGSFWKDTEKPAIWIICTEMSGEQAIFFFQSEPQIMRYLISELEFVRKSLAQLSTKSYKSKT